MKNIFIYTGEGAYHAKDIENFLAVFDFDYKRISEYKLNNLSQPGILIVPGGQIKAFLPAWGESGVKAIKNFILSGGVYIGICAGSYIAGESFNGVPGLSFFPGTLEHRKYQKIINVKDNSGNTYQLIAENGPDLSNIIADEVILKDKTGKPQALRKKIGRGEVYLFAAHPEGSVFYNKLPQNFSGAIFFNKFLRKLRGS